MAASLEDFTPEQIAEMASTYHALVSNPETREIALRATKKVNPSLSVPEIDLKDAARAEFKKINERNDAMEQQIRERDAKERVREERTKLREQGYSADEVSAIEKIMMDEHIPSYQTAANYYKGQQQMAQPTPHNAAPATTFTMPPDALSALKGGKQSLNKFGREAATAALDEIRSGQIKLH